MSGKALCAASAACLIALVWSIASPALAMSTSQEIAKGREESDQIDRQSIVVNDPFLSDWVQRMGQRLAEHRKRADIQYKFIILNTPEINAFALPGGFVHVNTGLLNFVDSDDELAGTIGHEMGHVELHHVTKQENQSTIMSILLGVLSVVSPVAGILGSLGGTLALDRYSRTDELQADHYGLTLMTQAGYDPRATVDMMTKLGKMDPGPESRADKAFRDHPNPSDRVAHLMGYSELDKPTKGSRVAAAIHDQDEGRFNYARMRLAEVLALDPNTLDPLAQEHVSQLDIALRESGPRAAPDTRVVAALAPGDPLRADAVRTLHALISDTDSALTSAKKAARNGLAEVDDLAARLQRISNGDTSGASGGGSSPPPGGKGKSPNLHSITGALERIARDMTATIEFDGDVFGTAAGLIGANRETLREMDDLVADPQLTPKSQTLLTYYPSLLANMMKSNKGLQGSMDASKASVDRAGNEAQAVSAVMGLTKMVDPVSGDIPDGKMPAAKAIVDHAVSTWDDLAKSAEAADNQMYAAQARNLSAEISLLDLYSAPERYAAYTKALAYRFNGVAIPDYAAATKSGFLPGDVACAAWVSFETKEPALDVLRDVRAAGGSCEDYVVGKRMMGLSLEIASGLVYENYIDEPQKAK
jgi:Zn-dependent protease with chaperone function